MVVSGADVEVPADAVRLLPHHQRQLDVRLDPLHAVGDVRSRLFELPPPADVGRLVESCGDLDQDRHLLALPGRFLERLDDRGAAAGPVDRELDRQHGRIHRGTLQELQDRGVEAVIRQVHQDVPAADLVEHRGRIGAVQAPQPRMGDRPVRRVTQLVVARHRQFHEVPEAEQPGGRDDVGRVGIELGREPAPQAHRHVGAGFQAYHARILPGGQLGRDHPDDGTGREVHVVIPGLVGPRVILGPAGDPEEVAGQFRRPREERAQVVRDHLLKGHPAGLIRQRHPPRPVGRHFDPDKAAVAPARLGDLDRQVEAEVADEREGMCGVRRKRGEDRFHRVREILGEEVPLRGAEIPDIQDRGPQVAQGRAQLLLDQPGHQHLLGPQLRAAGLEHLSRGQAVRPMPVLTPADPPEQAADPLHRELVVDHAHDPGELDPLQQRLRRVLGQGQHAAGEAEPAQLPVDKGSRRVRRERYRLRH